MLADLAYFSLLEITDASKHRAFNAYHQLDHRPENLALPGVVWGDRWVVSPDCAALASGSDAELRRKNYITMYWFADPAERSMREWIELGDRTFEWGRRPGTDYERREMFAVMPVKGYVHPRVLVSADALPFRPVRGVHVTVLAVPGPRTAAAEAAFAWYDRVGIPDLLSCPGVAGAWTFTNVGAVFDPPGAPGRNTIRVHVLFLDEDPVEVTAGIDSQKAQWALTGDYAKVGGVLVERLCTPLRAITPWQWDWFE